MIRIQFTGPLLCEDCGRQLIIRGKKKRFADAAQTGPWHGVYMVKLARVAVNCQACGHIEQVTVLLIRGHGETEYKAYQIRRDEDPQEAMKRVLDALYQKRIPEPAFVGRYYGRV